MSQITVAKKNGNLVITAPIDTALPESSSGKTQIVCSSHGNVNTGIEIDGKPIHLGLNAYVYPTGKKGRKNGRKNGSNND